MKRLSALAQLVALYAEKGITKTAELTERTGYCDRAIRKARAELECHERNPSSGTPVPEEPQFRNPGAGTGTPVPPEPQVSRADITTHANKESLRDESSNKAVKSLVTKREDSVTPYGRDCGPSGVSDSKPPAKKENLAERFASAVDDPTHEDDEARYAAAFDVLAKAGLARSQIAKLGRLIGEHDEALQVLRSVAKARDPATYLAKIVRNRQEEAKQESLALAGLLEEPDWVREYRIEGHRPIRKLANGNWEIARWTFDPEGLEIGG